MSLVQKSKSCILHKSQHKSTSNSQEKSTMTTKKRLSLCEIRKVNKSPANKKSYKETFTKSILTYIEKRSDVQIINHYTQYKQQFYRKAFSLQSLLYKQPFLKQKYLSQENSHFFKGFQQRMLSLFRKKLIVPGSYANMRQQAVEEIQRWVLSWIQRQKVYQKSVQQQQIEISETKNLLNQIQAFSSQIRNQKNLF